MEACTISCVLCEGPWDVEWSEEEGDGGDAPAAPDTDADAAGTSESEADEGFADPYALVESGTFVVSYKSRRDSSAWERLSKEVPFVWLFPWL